MFERTSRSLVLTASLLLQLSGFGCEDAPASPVEDAGSSGAGGLAAGSSGRVAAGSGGAGEAAADSGGAGSAGAAAAAGKAGSAGNTAAVGGEALDRSTVQPNVTPEVEDSAYAALIAQLNQFGLELGRRQVEANKLSDKNTVFAPISASIALSMTYAGARGVTATEFEAALTGGIAADSYHTGINRLSRELASRTGGWNDAWGMRSNNELNIADALYVEAELDVLPGFLDQLSRDYDSGVHRSDFQHDFEAERVRINDWVAGETNDKIKDLLTPGVLDADTRMVLVNALYFYGSWRDKFAVAGTSAADFHTLADQTVSVPTMHKQLLFSVYKETDAFAAVDLPYVGDHLSMLCVLPKAGQFESVRDAVSGQWFESTLKDTKRVTVNLALPKFKMTTDSLSLNESLKAMGFTTALSDAANFSGISADGGLKIGDVVQRAFIGVDETGTEAAAATAVTVAPAAAPVEIVDLTLDRPFLFFIHDDSGIVLFSGQVVDPSAG